MSDTQGLKSRVEDEIRAVLEKEFGQVFMKGSLPVGKKADGGQAVREFDAISKDKQVIASIKASSWTTSGGNVPAAKINSFYAELYFFSLIGRRRRKLLVFTEKEAMEGFKKICDGKKPADVELVHRPLSPGSQRLVRSIRVKASRENGAKFFRR